MLKFSTLREAEIKAKKKINYKIFNWLQSGAEDDYTLNKNFLDLKSIKIIPKHLSRINKINTNSYFFKTKLEYPILLAPMGHQTQFHKYGEIETCDGAKKANILSFFGTQSRMKLEQIARKNNFIGWTIFPFGDLKWIDAQIYSAEKNKCIAIIL